MKIEVIIMVVNVTLVVHVVYQSILNKKEGKEQRNTHCLWRCWFLLEPYGCHFILLFSLLNQMKTLITSIDDGSVKR